MMLRRSSDRDNAPNSVMPSQNSEADHDYGDLDLIQRARENDSEAFGELFRRYRVRLFGLARRYFAPGSDRDDLIQEATIGFFKAIRDFKGDRGTFGAFAELCVRRQVITLIKAATRQKHAALNWATSLDAPAFADSEEPLVARLAASAGPDMGGLSDATAFLESLWSRCSSLERGILSLYSRGYSFAEMAFELGVHWKSIDNAVWRVKVKARKLLSEKNHESLAVRYSLKNDNVS